MPNLKLAKLPDRKPVRITITVRPELNASLQTYAELYRETYGDEESVQQLIPFMLENFLKGDCGFAKARREKAERGRRFTPRPQRSRSAPALSTAT